MSTSGTAYASGLDALRDVAAASHDEILLEIDIDYDEREGWDIGAYELL